MFSSPHWIGPPFVFDAAKEAANQLKHGISLKLAELADWHAAHVKPDTRREYGEVRLTCRVPIRTRIHVAIVVPRERTFRIISLRKANNREVQDYEQAR
ncbi:BrnT family toxin [Burkholderia guangdongensis]|uniref:BrnT family toxin n=1 Tax=Burkholderia guangdongensis TaxID=1792500 RepID=UPI0015CE96BC|nr:BrnT family toxin [Burkholderia guangdongensis]